MNNLLAGLLSSVNQPANQLFGKLLAFTGGVPGWVSNTISAVIVGIVVLPVFKHTSNQGAIKKARDSIKANLLAMKLFRDSIRVTLLSQARLFVASGRLLLHSIPPLLVMLVPMALILAQMGLWYQARPLAPGHDAVVTVKMNRLPAADVFTLLPGSAAAVQAGPVRIPGDAEVVWKIRALEPGYHTLRFQIGEETIEKQFAAGEGFMRVSPVRPGWNWVDILMYPLEKPFPPDATVHSVRIDYPDRESFTSGTDSWVIYFFAASMVVALLLRPFLRVNI